MRRLIIVPGSDIIGAFLNDAPFPLSSSLDSQPIVESYLADASLILIRNIPLTFCFTNGKRESLGCFLFAKRTIENAGESFSVV